jgi:hypothetical protein
MSRLPNSCSERRINGYHFQLAKATGMAVVVDLPVNLGLVVRCRQVCVMLHGINFDCALQFDADGQHKASDVNVLVNMVLSGECDVLSGQGLLAMLRCKVPIFSGGSELGCSIF